MNIITVVVEPAGNIPNMIKYKQEFKSVTHLFTKLKECYPGHQYVIYYPRKEDERYGGEDINVKVFPIRNFKMGMVEQLSDLIEVITGYDFHQVGTHPFFIMNTTPWRSNINKPYRINDKQINQLKDMGIQITSLSSTEVEFKVN